MHQNDDLMIFLELEIIIKNLFGEIIANSFNFVDCFLYEGGEKEEWGRGKLCEITTMLPTCIFPETCIQHFR